MWSLVLPQMANRSKMIMIHGLDDGDSTLSLSRGSNSTTKKALLHSLRTSEDGRIRSWQRDLGKENLQQLQQRAPRRLSAEAVLVRNTNEIKPAIAARDLATQAIQA